MRVHELAKELDKTNKEVLDLLKEKNIEVKSHMSSITDEQVQMVKNHYNGPKVEPKAEAPKKKMAMVFRPQNSQNAQRQGYGQNQQRRNNNYQSNQEHQNIFIGRYA